jgi:hypothetical protein
MTLSQDILGGNRTVTGNQFPGWHFAFETELVNLPFPGGVAADLARVAPGCCLPSGLRLAVNTGTGDFVRGIRDEG